MSNAQKNTDPKIPMPTAQLCYGRLLTSSIFTLVVGPSKKSFYVHKELLGKISPEFRKHTHNDMKEGTDNVMTISDVMEDTVARFLEWAYTSDYPDDIQLPTEEAGDEAKDETEATTSSDPAKDEQSPNLTFVAPSSRLLPHAQVYVFADRFNIGPLKTLAFGKVTVILSNLEYLKDPRDVSDVIEVLSYASENLPFTKSGDQLLDYLVYYAAWTLDILRKDNCFWALLESNAEMGKAMLKIAPEIDSPPWKIDGLTVNTVTKSKTKGQKRLKTEFLDRRCNYCSWRGVFLVHCGSCNYWDHEINGAGAELTGNLVNRLGGSSTSLSWKCGNCSNTGSPNLGCGRCHRTNSYSYV